MQSPQVLLHISLIDSVGPSATQGFIELFTQGGALAQESLGILYAFSVNDFVHFGKMSRAKAQVIHDGLADRSRLEKELSLIEQHAISWVTVMEKGYPSLLKNIHLPPLVLYTKGTLIKGERLFAVVGSRKADSYGLRAVSSFVSDLVKNGWGIVSGGALGIDAQAHKVSLENGGSTLAVLGSGLLKPYPFAHKGLFQRIVEQGGCLVSPFPLQMAPQPGLFPARNRIIAGLSRGCLVVQAARASGALITARWALNEGREIFAVPGAFDNALSAGCHQLISQGATVATSYQDIEQVFGGDN